MEEKQRKNSKFSPPKCAAERVVGLDLSFQGLKSLSSPFLLHTTIKELLLNNNEIEHIPREIYKLRNLEKLNLSHNKIRSIPPELGKAVSLKELYLNDNSISSVPMELGTLFNLEILNITNNPLIAPFNSLCKDKTLIHFCRENNTSYPPPADRAWIDMVFRKDNQCLDSIAVGTFNILSNFYAVKCTYAPSWVINPELRRENILNSILSYNVDILALQEIETCLYHEYYKIQLDQKLEYDSTFLPRSRSLTLADKRMVDGCATFWKRNKFKLIEQINVDFFQKIITDSRFATNQDVINRNMRKDNITLITVLESQDGFQTIVVNTHIHWDPEYSDVKLLQAILLIEDVEKIRQKYKHASMLFMGDFNSLRDSPVYKLVAEQEIDGSGFGLYDYTPFNAGFSHSMKLLDSYGGQDITFTNFTPTFKEVIDYIFYSEELVLTGVLSPIEEEYTAQCVGLPNIHFPSDHVLIGAKYCLKNKLKKIEPPK
ncbi:uncharacterized protein VICG_00233 [Vittaforma corneae ATCC 50505]|uniref:poly(A)-specific ribonuclease n=1 Tax=Vittaforma corneae (strain ATCC 50505) TaxID=993615 RepID=L2GPU3_VITCO|nr:uncharacterized protein VICG_00233 [Vittaforma corneae ATCC 50505]ELA42918.1 hypothetical protein VICG_00233 [Vittaforma corneae ATCC 50505]